MKWDKPLYTLIGFILVVNLGKMGEDLQCGYIGSLYSSKCEFKSTSFIDNSSSLSQRIKISGIMNYGLSKIFSLQEDSSWYEKVFFTDFQIESLLGDKNDAGRLILESILFPEKNIKFEYLEEDRKKCFQMRDCFPIRPTEILPFGLIDIELMLCYPEKSVFSYPETMKYEPTNDKIITESITAFHMWD